MENNKKNQFSYTEYVEILKLYSPIIIDFKDVNSSNNKFCVLRHDVEFSLERALSMAKLDFQYDVKSSFFIQVMNSAYNPLSTINKKILREIIDFGHNVGLHFYTSHILENDLEELKKELKIQTKILENCIEKDVDRFSFHRPSKWMLELDTSEFSALLNAYSKKYFELLTDEILPVKIKYIADSNHSWRYGHPLGNHPYQCFQLCLHPDEWSARGGSDLENFKALVSEQELFFIENIDLEYKTFAKIKKYFV
jgi:hypothetical protein